MARDRAARRDRRAAAGPRQTPWRRLSNPYEPVRILSDDQVEAIHGASLRLLEEIGLDVGARALWTRWPAPAPTWTGPNAVHAWTVA